METIRNLYWGPPDYLIISAIVVFNILFAWNYHKHFHLDFLANVFTAVLFVVVFPLLSIGYEVDRMQGIIGIKQGFSYDYLLYRFPLYFIFGITQLYIFHKYSEKEKRRNLRRSNRKKAMRQKKRKS